MAKMAWSLATLRYRDLPAITELADAALQQSFSPQVWRRGWRWWDDEMMRLLDDWMIGWCLFFCFKKTFLKSIFLVVVSASMQIVRDRYKNTYCGFQSKELLRDSVPYLCLDACQCDDSLMLPLSSSQRKRWNPESSLDGLARRFRKFSSNSQCHVCLDDLRNMRTLEAYCE